ncbi:MAG TPA: hypothetical protein VII73_10920 [Caulobacteraceae bacterium]
MSEVAPDDLADMARDELARACTLGWKDLAPLIPWGDAYEGFSPDGAGVTVERGYIWAGTPGGDILVEVAVYRGPSRYDDGARGSRLIPRASAAG